MDRKIKGRVSPPLFLPTMALRRAPLPSVASTSLKCLDNATESCAFKDVANSVTTRPTLLQQGSTNGEGEWRGMEERGGRLPRMSVNPARLIKARLATSWKRENALFTDSSLSLSLSRNYPSVFPPAIRVEENSERGGETLVATRWMEN